MSATLLPTAADVDALRTFLNARNTESAPGAQSPSAHRAHMILFGRLASGSIGYVAASLRGEEFSWLPGDDRRWWLLLQIARAYKDHPDFPDSIRPFLDAPEWDRLPSRHLTHNALFGIGL